MADVEREYKTLLVSAKQNKKISDLSPIARNDNTSFAKLADEVNDIKRIIMENVWFMCLY
jgi:hypothetical protein